MNPFQGNIISKLPQTSTSIFAVMSQLATEHNAVNLSQGFPDFPISAELIDLVNHYMKDGFEAFKATVDLASLSVDGFKGLMIFIGIGVLATVIMQSSHATIVLILAALSVGQITYENASLPIGYSQTISQPQVVALMSQSIAEGKCQRVLEIGTGFMLIKKQVFDDFREAYPQFSYTPDHNRSEHFKGDRNIHAYFDTVIDSKAYLGDIAGGSDRYLSEDYFFCQFVRRIGYNIYLCPWMKIGHMGSYVFSGSMASLANLEFAAHGKDTAKISDHAKRRKKTTKRKKKK